MPYATVESMHETYGERLLSVLGIDDAEDLGDSTQLATAVAVADATVDSYLAEDYSLPFATPPAQIVAHACTIAWYHLLSTFRSEVLSQGDTDAHAGALKYLRDVSTGKARLIVTGASKPTQASVNSGLVELSDAANNRTWLTNF